MSDDSNKKPGPPSTRAIDAGLDLPAPKGSDPYGKSDPLPAGLLPTLEMIAGPNAPGVTHITKSVTVLGRGQRMVDVDVGDGSASRRHAYIKYRDGAFWLCDMGSTNGTVLNGALVAEAKLDSGDEIQIGTAVMRFAAKR